MTYDLLTTLLISCPLLFLAGFIDSAAGGGGLISITAYMAAGLPPHNAVATNKVTMSFGTGLASYKFIRSGNVLLGVAIFSAIGALLGASVGTSLALLISEDLLKIILLAGLPPIAIFLSVKKSFGSEATQPRDFSRFMTCLLSFAIGLVIGCYDGLIGPGTGTFLIIAFSAILRIDLLTASGCAKVSNLASGISSAILYIINGKVVWLVALPTVVFCMAGSSLGSRYAIKGGSKNVRKVMFVVLGLLFIKIILDLFGITF